MNLNQVSHPSNLAALCHSVTKEFGKGESRTVVLRGVDLETPLGGITMLAGESGCGKTTLISIIAGLLNQTAGRVEVLGQDPSRLSSRELAIFRRRNLGFVFQQFNLLPSLTAAENAAVPLLAAGVPKKEAVGRATALLERLHLGHRAAMLPGLLSGGQQQRIAFARALIHEPKLIICDEPTSALDGATGRAVMETLDEIAVRSDRAVIVVTHDHRIFEFADSVVRMDDGQIVDIQTGLRGRAAA
jgi:putative ABC transport system ATP-binding protein